MLYQGIESTYATRTRAPWANGQKLLRYWEGFNAYARSTSFVRYFSLKRPQPKNWYDTYLNTHSLPLSFVFDISQHHIQASIHTTEKEAFNTLFLHRKQIEAALGFLMEWHYAPGSARSCIKLRRSHEFADMMAWRDGYQWYVDMAMLFKEVLPKYLLSK